VGRLKPLGCSKPRISTPVCQPRATGAVPEILGRRENPGQCGQLKFDFDRDPATLTRARQIYDASSFDLRAFRAQGGKILMWHGWADGAIMVTSSIGYYEGVMKVMGGRKETEDFFRLFLVPGVHHGGGGPGLTEFDTLTALENWVEKGQPPEKLIACRSANSVVERCRPVFPYPVLAHYSGKGDPKMADSFVPF